MFNVGQAFQPGIDGRQESLPHRDMNKMKYDDLLDRSYDEFCSEAGDDGCYGLAMEVCRRMGIELPDYRVLALEISSQEKIEKYKSRFREVSHPEAGDLALIRSMDGNEHHIAIMIERGRFLQATREHGVFPMRLSHPLYRDRIEGIYRLKR